MTRSIPWPRILAEGFAIVVSILLAFGIQAWWEDRQDRESEQILLQGLLEDLRDDSGDYADFEQSHTVRLRAADLLLDLAGDQSANQEGVDQARASGMTSADAFARLGVGSMLETVRVAYDQITAAGISEVVSDQVLRDRLARYYALAADRGPVNGAILDVNELFRSALLGHGYTPFDGERIDPSSVLADPQVRAIIRLSRRTSEAASRTGGEMHHEVTQLIATVERNLR